MYLRHRHRLVRESVWDDLVHSLAAFGWTGENHLPLASQPVNLEQAYPENREVEDAGVENELPLNSLLVDEGAPGVPFEHELGGRMAQQYTFTYAFYGESEAVSLAVLNDLYDRYNGTIPHSHALWGVLHQSDLPATYDPMEDVWEDQDTGADPWPVPPAPVIRSGSDFITLWDYNNPVTLTRDDTTTFQRPLAVRRMEVESFRYARPDDEQAPHEGALFVAELILIDFLDQD